MAKRPRRKGALMRGKMKKTPRACPRCFALAFDNKIRAETVMPIPERAPPLAIEDQGEHSPRGSAICHDCQAAENLAKMGSLAAWVATEPGGIKHPYRPKGMSFASRRIVVGNERQEQLRLPLEMREHFSLVKEGIVLKSEGDNALEKHHDWLEAVGIKLMEPEPFGEGSGRRL